MYLTSSNTVITSLTVILFSSLFSGSVMSSIVFKSVPSVNENKNILIVVGR